MEQFATVLSRSIAGKCATSLVQIANYGGNGLSNGIANKGAANPVVRKEYLNFFSALP